MLALQRGFMAHFDMLRPILMISMVFTVAFSDKLWNAAYKSIAVSH